MRLPDGHFDNNSDDGAAFFAPQGSFVDRAVWAVEQGFRVFPVNNNRADADKYKRPHIKEWQLNATTELNEIESWGRRWPDANIGLTLENHLVLDIDVRNGGHVDPAWPAHWLETRRHFSGRGDGGFHLVFRLTPEQRALGMKKNNRALMGPGVDIQTGQGAMVIAPGSWHAEGAQRQYTTDEVDIAWCPDDLIQHIMREELRQASEDRARGQSHCADLIKAYVEMTEGEGRNDAMTKIAGHLAKDMRYEDAFTETLLAINKASVQPQPENDVRKTARSVWSSERRQQAQAIDLSENALANMLASQMRDMYRHVPGVGWRGYDGQVWATIPDAVMRTRVMQALELVHQRATGAGMAPNNAEVKALRKIQKAGTLMLGLEGLLDTPPDEFDVREDWLNTQSGIVDLRTGVLLPHHASAMMTKITRVAYKPGKTHPDWDSALVALGTEEDKNWFQVRMGQAITGEPVPDAKAIVMAGGGSNGKSCLMAMRGPLGTYARLVPQRLLATGGKDRHETEVMTLLGTRVAILEEMPQGNHLDPSRLKQILGTGEITARSMNKDHVTFKPTHALLVTTNERPTISQNDHGTWRRLILVNFPIKYVTEEELGGRALRVNERMREGGLLTRLETGQDQHEAILAWLVEGAKRYYEVRDQTDWAPLPEAVKADVQEWKRESDLFGTFFAEMLELDPSSYVTSRELLEEFNIWLKGRGNQPVNEDTMAKKVKNLDAYEMGLITKDRASGGCAHSTRTPSACVDSTLRNKAKWRGLRWVS